MKSKVWISLFSASFLTFTACQMGTEIQQNQNKASAPSTGIGGIALPVEPIGGLATMSLPSKVVFDVNDIAPYRVGFNFIREKSSTSYDSASAVIQNISEAGGQGMRQFEGFDISWFTIMTCTTYSSADCYDYSAPNPYFLNSYGLYSIPTLFQLGNSVGAKAISGDDSADCEDDDHKKEDYCRYPMSPSGRKLSDLDDSSVKSSVENYVKQVVSKYKENGIRHFEVLNEPSNYIYNWSIPELGLYTYYYKPEHYVDLLSTVKTAALSKNSNAKIVMAGLFYQALDSSRESKWEDWFKKILEEGAGNYIDVVNFHYYGKWDDLKAHIDRVKEIMADNNVDKPIWMTEVGSSATQENENKQAKNVFKYFAVAFGNGIKNANWHTHISRHNGTSGYGGYGTIKSGGEKYSSWYTYQLFSRKFGNFGNCSAIKEGGSNGVYVYKCSGALYPDKGTMPTRYIAWVDDSTGTNTYSLSFDYPSSWTSIKITKTVQSSDGTFTETTQSASTKLSLTTTPVVVEEN